VDTYKTQSLAVAGREFRVLMTYYPDGRAMTAFTYLRDIPGWFVIQLRPEPRVAGMIDEAKKAAELDQAAGELGYFDD
jgi:hypothetical protein